MCKIFFEILVELKCNMQFQSVYKKESILDITDSEIQFTINDQYFLETLLMEIRSKTISYASYSKKAKDKKKGKGVTRTAFRITKGV